MRWAARENSFIAEKCVGRLVKSFYLAKLAWAAF